MLVVLYVVILAGYTSHRMAFQGLYGLRCGFMLIWNHWHLHLLKQFGAGDMLGHSWG